MIHDYKITDVPHISDSMPYPRVGWTISYYCIWVKIDDMINNVEFYITPYFLKKNKTTLTSLHVLPGFGLLSSTQLKTNLLKNCNCVILAILILYPIIVKIL